MHATLINAKEARRIFDNDPHLNFWINIVDQQIKLALIKHQSRVDVLMVNFSEINRYASTTIQEELVKILTKEEYIVTRLFCQVTNVWFLRIEF